MKILVLEYITGGGLLNEPLPPSLAFEGELMLSALLQDLLDLGNIEIAMTRDSRLEMPPMGNEGAPLEVIRVADKAEFKQLWPALIKSCDAVWPIAPETDRVLEQLCRDVIMAGKTLLNSPPEMVRLTASKRRTASRLQSHGIGAVPTYPLTALPPALSASWVVKPDDGVGCVGSRVIDRENPWPDDISPEQAANWVIQPYIPGQSLSLSVLFHGGRAFVLSCNEQKVSVVNGRFVLAGVRVNAVKAHRYQGLADRIAEAFPRLWGYGGIDLIVNQQGARVLEINPRLTTSYAGLRKALGINPAGLVLSLLEGCEPLADRVQEGANSVFIELAPCQSA